MAIRELHKQGITSVGTDDFGALPNKDYKQIVESYLDLRETMN